MNWIDRAQDREQLRGLCKILQNSSLTEGLATSQERFSSMELFNRRGLIVFLF
jgi:hypothetical protein